MKEYDCDPSGFVALLEAMKTSAIAKLSISDCDIGPKGLMTSAPLISVIPALSEVNVSQNKCFGSKGNGKATYSPEYKVIHDIDKDQSGWTAFCEALPGTKIEKLILSDIGIGPLGLTTLAKFTPDSPALNTITLDSTGDEKKQKKYTISGLQGGAEPSLDLSSLNFGPADVSFLATLMTTFTLKARHELLRAVGGAASLGRAL